MRAFSRTSAMSSSRIRPATGRSLCRRTRRPARAVEGYPGGTPPGDPTTRSRRQDGTMTFSDPPAGSRTPGPVPVRTEGPPIGALVHDLTQQLPELIRSELRLAQAEVTEKGKRAGLGIGMFSVAGLLAYFAAGVLIATAILALDLVLPSWLPALVVALVLLAAAGAVALLGKREVAQATPAKPERAIEGVKEDIATVKGARR